MKKEENFIMPTPTIPTEIQKPKELLTICAFRGNRKKWTDFKNRCKFMKRDIYYILEPYIDEFLKTTQRLGLEMHPEELETIKTRNEQRELRRAFIEAEEEGRVLQVGK